MVGSRTATPFAVHVFDGYAVVSKSMAVGKLIHDAWNVIVCLTSQCFDNTASDVLLCRLFANLLATL